MLLSAVIICCMAAANAEPALNSYSFTEDGNGYDYSNSVTNNGYLGSKDPSYQNVESFYGDTSHKLSSHINSHKLLNNAANQGNVGGEVGNSYNNGYSANDQGNEYAGYSSTYENSDRDSYALPTRATSFAGYSGRNTNGGESDLNAYTNAAVQQSSDLGQYSSDNKRIPVYSGYSKSTVLERYPEESAGSDSQIYHDTTDSLSYTDSDHVYAPYTSPDNPISEYSFGKQKGGPAVFKGRNKYGDVHSTVSEGRYARGNAGHNRDVASYLSDSRTGGQFFKAHAVSPSEYASGKPSKYGYKYFSRYAPNSGLSYLSPDAYYSPYGKGSRKIIIIKESRPNYTGHAYSEPSNADNGGYMRNQNGGFMGSYSASSNFDGYGGGNSNYDEGRTMPRRYRYATSPIILKTVYS